MKKERVGLFGGTFNPVHIGHVALVREALKHLDRLVVMPCGISPHKLEQRHDPQFASGKDRLEMLRLAFQDEPRIEISDWEINQTGPSFTWQTLAYLRSREPDVEWALVLGWDQFQVLPTWDRFADWASTTSFLVFHRAGVIPSELPTEVQALDTTIVAALLPLVSSSDIRQKIGLGNLPLDLLTGKVVEYILHLKLFSQKNQNR
jgi:nicotinate-nucleotide adenylyltransferase